MHGQRAKNEIRLNKNFVQTFKAHVQYGEQTIYKHGMPWTNDRFAKAKTTMTITKKSIIQPKTNVSFVNFANTESNTFSKFPVIREGKSERMRKRRK